MTPFRIRPALIVWVIATLVIVVSGWILLPFPRRPTGWEEIVWAIGSGMGFTTVGALLMDRRPRETVSRITLGVGLIVVSGVALRAFSVWLEAQPGDTPPLVGVAALLSESMTALAFLAVGGFFLVRFPDGRHRDVLSAAVDLITAMIAVAVALQVFQPGPIDVSWISPMENPLGIAALDPVINSWFSVFGLVAYAVGLILAIVEVASRYRTSDPVVRAQIRWVAAAGAVPLVLVPFIVVAEWLWSLWFVSTMLLPLAIGVALLRYRLFDIDRIVGRTIAYAIVTAILAGVFVAANLLLVALFADATGSSTLLVAASTLLVAGLFQPIRRRVQVPVDRRFNRAHLDGERVVGTFARQTRDEVDLERLQAAVVRTVDESIAPSATALWLRPARHRP
jgi:hypothetical protein